MKTHMETAGTCCVALSYEDGSFWCFSCVDDADGFAGTYVVSPLLRPVSQAFEQSKFNSH